MDASDVPDTLAGSELEFAHGTRRGVIKRFSLIGTRLAISFSRSWAMRDGTWVETADRFATIRLREEQTRTGVVLVPRDEPCTFVIVPVESPAAADKKHAVTA